MDDATKAKRDGGYARKPNDLITVKECVLLIHDIANRAVIAGILAEREHQRSRVWHRRLRAAVRRLRRSKRRST
jgi:hypothetical protein